jgi:PadR family transcriptional regulator, regulatory protein PadR
MPKPVSVGQFEQAVMTAVLALGENAYGVTIHAKTEELAGGKSVALGAVYATLDRLEDKGLISSRLSDPTPERGGRAKRYYRLEATGSQALHESALMSKRICDTIETSWGESVWKPGKWKPARQP